MKKYQVFRALYAGNGKVGAYTQHSEHDGRSEAEASMYTQIALGYSAYVNHKDGTADHLVCAQIAPARQS